MASKANLRRSVNVLCLVVHERAALRGNAVVSISAGADGARTTTVPFLDGSIRLASGPVSLALSTGAALLPVFAAREDTGEVAATIGAPIDISSAPDRGQATVNAAGAFAGWLEGRALGTPGQIVWHYDMFRPPTLPTT